MDADFWHRKWANHEIGFYEAATNPLLVKQVHALGLLTGQCMFLPLCGKTLDIGWLLAEGYRVVGAERSKRALEQLPAWHHRLDQFPHPLRLEVNAQTRGTDRPRSDNYAVILSSSGR
ncbi:MAG: hypothetical protein J0L95_02790 [Candidatus Accumulibacter sp.]|jgi:hypothetical protein|uniref:hypothetical protein n=1 Tax=Accumulibacter sp. TaxID=2053492 RepID=UPI001AD415EE|nr:hypothetical protein [Accumulibacter sp.]MBN8436963.1 hypothetical protein [Accumulibacter sp.]